MPEDQLHIIKEWLIAYLKNRDIFYKSIVNIKDKGKKVFVEYKDRNKIFLLRPLLSNDIAYDDEQNMFLITLNIKKNLDYLITNWYRLAKHPKLIIYFINPYSATDTSWIIRPHLHNKIADDDSLKNGLEALFSSVDEFHAM